MKLYHQTWHGEQILSSGFRDGEGTYLTSNTYRGVWLSDRPLDCNDGAEGDYLLCVEIPESVVADHEWVEESKTYREFLVPAAIVNRYHVERAPDDDHMSA